MSFLAHFGLKERPFALTPDTGLYFPAEEHREVLASLIYAIESGAPIVKVVGEVGTGKTLLSRLLINELIDKMATAYILNPQNDADWVVGAVCREFGLNPNDTTDPFHALNSFLLAQHEKGKRTGVVVDEAQALGPVGLETIRRLSNLETDKSKLLQIVLFGQPELKQILRSDSLRQVKQRVVFSFALRPLSHETAMEYIRYRIQCTSASAVAAHTLIGRKALSAIARESHGIPRLINIIADKSLLAAYGHGATRVSTRHVREAVEDSREMLAQQLSLKSRRWQVVAAMLAGGAVLGLLAAGWTSLGSGETLRLWLVDRLLDLLELLQR